MPAPEPLYGEMSAWVPPVGAVGIALWTMQRQSDLLTMPTLAFNCERISIKQGKTGAWVRVVAAPDLLPVLKRVATALVNSFGNWTSNGFWVSWRKETKQLGIMGVTFHDLRGTAITSQEVIDAIGPRTKKA